MKVFLNDLSFLIYQSNLQLSKFFFNATYQSEVANKSERDILIETYLNPSVGIIFPSDQSYLGFANEGKKP